MDRKGRMSTRRSTEGNSSGSKVAPIVREFVRVDGGAGVSASSQPDCIRFRLVSYNILAQVDLVLFNTTTKVAFIITVHTTHWFLRAFKIFFFGIFKLACSFKKLLVCYYVSTCM